MTHCRVIEKSRMFAAGNPERASGSHYKIREAAFQFSSSFFMARGKGPSGLG